MKINVELRAFGEGGEIRVVEVPGHVAVAEIGSCPRKEWLEKVADLVFKYGQNDFQPRKQRSVSMGDVIAFSERERLVVCAIGFRWEKLVVYKEGE